MRECKNCLYNNLSSNDRKFLFKGRTRTYRLLRHIIRCSKCSISKDRILFESNSKKMFMGGVNKW